MNWQFSFFPGTSHSCLHNCYILCMNSEFRMRFFILHTPLDSEFIEMYSICDRFVNLKGKIPLKKEVDGMKNKQNNLKNDIIKK